VIGTFHITQKNSIITVSNRKKPCAQSSYCEKLLNGFGERKEEISWNFFLLAHSVYCDVKKQSSTDAGVAA
jgi:hypothetical protein